MDITNKVALITGGASGLGLATAELFIESGAKVMLLDLNEDNAKAATEKLGSNSSYVIANVTDESSVQEAVDKMDSHFSNKFELGEFYEDGVAIIDWFKKNSFKILFI